MRRMHDAQLGITTRLLKSADSRPRSSRCVFMKPTIFRFVFILLAITYLSGCSNIGSYLPSFPIEYDARNLQGDWVGFNDLKETQYHLSLSPTSGGMLIINMENDALLTNQIVGWRIQDGGLVCRFRESVSPNDPSVLTCEIQTSLLVGRLVGVGKWRETIRFRRRAFIERSLIN